MDTDTLSGRMARGLKVDLLIIILMEKDIMDGPMAENTMEIGLIIK